VKKTSFLFNPLIKYPTQKELNIYFYRQVERINKYAIEWDENYEWKEKMIKKLANDYCGYPKKLTLLQRFFN